MAGASRHDREEEEEEEIARILVERTAAGPVTSLADLARQFGVDLDEG